MPKLDAARPVDHTGPVEDPPTWRFQLGVLALIGLVAVYFVVGTLLVVLWTLYEWRVGPRGRPHHRVHDDGTVVTVGPG